VANTYQPQITHLELKDVNLLSRTVSVPKKFIILYVDEVLPLLEMVRKYRPPSGVRESNVIAVMVHGGTGVRRSDPSIRLTLHGFILRQ